MLDGQPQEAALVAQTCRDSRALNASQSTSHRRPVVASVPSTYSFLLLILAKLNFIFRRGQALAFEATPVTDKLKYPDRSVCVYIYEFTREFARPLVGQI